MVSPFAMIGMGCMVAALGATLFLLKKLGAHDVAASVFFVAIFAVVAAVTGAVLH